MQGDVGPAGPAGPEWAVAERWSKLGIIVSPTEPASGSLITFEAWLANGGQGHFGWLQTPASDTVFVLGSTIDIALTTLSGTTMLDAVVVPGSVVAFGVEVPLGTSSLTDPSAVVISGSTIEMAMTVPLGTVQFDSVIVTGSTVSAALEVLTGSASLWTEILVVAGSTVEAAFEVPLGTAEVVAAAGGPASFLGAGDPVTNAAAPFPNVTLEANDLVVLFAAGSSGAPAGWSTYLQAPANSGGACIYYKYAAGGENSGTTVACEADVDGDTYPYTLYLRTFACRDAPTSSPISTHSESAMQSEASSASWTGTALTDVEAGSMLCYFVFAPGRHATAVGGGVDTMVTHASGTGFDLGYKANVSGSPGAPTMTLDGASAGVSITLAVKGT